jgi:SEC-C motif-containing protein
MSKTSTISACPCGSGKKFDDCCGIFIEGTQQPETPEQLMRSRYTAFVMQDMEYVQKTTDPQTKFDFDFEANRSWAEESEFVGLKILKTSMDGNKGMVEFQAQFRSRAGEGSATVQTHHEISKFRKQAGVWYFREGRVLSEA